MILACHHISKEYPENTVLRDVTFHLERGDKAALIGINGAGKTTLLRIIVGEESADEGSVSFERDCSYGYLAQNQGLSSERTVYEEVLSVKQYLIDMENRLSEYERQMEVLKGEALTETITEYTDLLHRFERENGYAYKGEVLGVLKGLGFSSLELDQKVSTLSGGQKTRVALGKLLLQKPDLLMLDEPTNHLDIESIQWLEQWLAQSAKAVVLVSHDRAFINNVANRTLEISCGQIIDYKVKYDEYVVLRKERREQQLRAYENQQKEIQEMRQFIERFRYQATKAVQVQQKVKQLEKIVPIEVDEVDNSALHLKFPPCLRSGDYPVICEDVRKDYGAHTVFSNVNLTIKRGEKVAFVGKNGEGKSTLVKCIMGEIPFDGHLKVGHNIQIGYFAQNQAQLLDEELTVFQTIDNVAKGEIRLRINDILGAFMFGGEASDKKVKVLSGGERSRLAMIRLLLEPVNLLILDEPTNHLDMPSKDVLKEAIRAFDGTAIIVSHDREFLDGLVSKVYEFGGGKVREHLGGIYEWLRKEHEAQISNGSNGLNGSNGPIKPINPTKNDYATHKEQQKRLRKAEKAVEESERKISDMERRLKELDDLLMIPENAADMTLVTEYTTTKKALDEEVERWERLSEELETIN